MSASVEQPNKPEGSELIANAIVSISFAASSGALAGHLFSLIDPIGGAVFGATVSVVGPTIGKGLENVFGKSRPEKIVRFAVKFFGSVLVALGLTMATGFPIAFSAAVKLTLLMLPASVITWVAFRSLTFGAEIYGY